MSSISNELKKIWLMTVYSFLEKNPDENLPKLLDWVDEHVKDDVLTKQRELFRDIITKKDSNWYRLMTSLWRDYDPDVLKVMFENIIVNAAADAAPVLEENRRRFHCNIPWILAIELKDDEDSGNTMDFDEWDDVITQSKKLGTFMYVIMGGDPLENKEETVALCNKHSDCEFMIVSDGERFDEDFAREMLRVRNMIMAFKVNSLKELDALERPTEILRNFHLPFITTTLYDRTSQKELANEAFFDHLIAMGVKLGFFLSRLSSAEDEVYKKILEYRNTKAFMAIQFCKDKDIIGGCVAGGRYYSSINSRGDVEPCFFVSRSDANVRKMPLIDAYRQPLFRSYMKQEIDCDEIED